MAHICTGRAVDPTRLAKACRKLLLAKSWGVRTTLNDETKKFFRKHKPNPELFGRISGRIFGFGQQICHKFRNCSDRATASTPPLHSNLIKLIIIIIKSSTPTTPTSILANSTHSSKKRRRNYKGK